MGATGVPFLILHRQKGRSNTSFSPKFPNRPRTEASILPAPCEGNNVKRQEETGTPPLHPPGVPAQPVHLLEGGQAPGASQPKVTADVRREGADGELGGGVSVQLSSFLH